MNYLKIWIVAFVCILIPYTATIAHESSTQTSVEQTPFPCGKCKGKKTILDIYGNQVTCPKCNGTGNEPTPDKAKLKPTQFPEANCQKCKGAKGWNTTYGWVKCDRCNGSGKEPKK